MATAAQILIVDDDRHSRTLISRVLKRAGYSTSEAATGEEALAAAKRERPALVIVEALLPGVSGYEVCRELKDEFGEALPIVFVSGTRTEPGNRVAGLLLGGDDYLVKPFDPDELLARARRLLPAPLTAGGNAYELTRRELHVLSQLVDGLPSLRSRRGSSSAPRRSASTSSTSWPSSAFIAGHRPLRSPFVVD